MKNYAHWAKNLDGILFSVKLFKMATVSIKVIGFRKPYGFHGQNGFRVPIGSSERNQPPREVTGPHFP